MPEFKFNWEDKKVVTLRGHEGYLKDVRISSDGKYIISSTDCINIWDGKSLDFFRNIKAYTGSVASVDISPDSSLLVSSEDKSYEEEKEFHEIKTYKMIVSL